MIEFSSDNDVNLALEKHRFPVIKDGKMSRAMPFTSNWQAKESDPEFLATSIFVKGFHALGWDHSDLYSRFS